MVTHKSIKIGNKVIGDGSSCFIIAEAGVNHNGDIKIAKKLVDIASQSGVDAVKFQSFSADLLTTREAPLAEYQRNNNTQAQSQYAMLKKLELGKEAHTELSHYCREKGVIFCSSPFDQSSADLLTDLDVPFYKIPSGELTNHPFLEYIAGNNKPMIVSTGMSTLQEVSEALKVIYSTGNKDVILLHCVSNYPADPKEVNLRAMISLKKEFHIPIGFSDHTTGIEVSLAAVALGAVVIEKHFTIDKKLYGPDHKASLSPDELHSLVRGIKIVEASLGEGTKSPSHNEKLIAKIVRKSLVAAIDLPAGTEILPKHIAIKRPGTGLPPSKRAECCGKRIRIGMKAGQMFSLENLE